MLEENLKLLKILENCELYDKMLTVIDETLSHLKTTNKQIPIKFRYFISTTFKNLIFKKRAEFRALKYEAKKLDDNSESLKKSIIVYINSNQQEIDDICNKILTFVDTKILENKSVIGGDENYAFFFKLKADFLRYIAETKTDDVKKELSKDILSFYKKSEEYCKNLEVSSPIKLALYLNLSIFYYEIMHEYSTAIEIAQKYSKEGMEILDNLKAEESKDFILIVQLLRDNVNIWKTNQQDKINESTMNVENYDGEF